MKACPDTNAWLSSLALGAAYEMFRLMTRRRVVIVSSVYILDEIDRKLSERFMLKKPARRVFLAAVERRISRIVTPLDLPPSSVPDDIKDVPVLGTALAGKCDVLITRDRDLLDLTVPGLSMMKPGAFLRVLESMPQVLRNPSGRTG